MNSVIFTKVNIFRNLKDYKFLPKLENTKKEEIVEKVSDALKGKMSLNYLPKASEEFINKLKENGLLTPNVNNIFTKNEGNTIVEMFSDEHIAIKSSTFGFDRQIFNDAKEISDLFSNKLNLAFSDEYGFLMSDLKKVGSGIKIESLLSLNGLSRINKIEQVKQNVAKLGYSLIPTDLKNVYVLTTNCNLGFSEKEVFEDFEKTLKNIDNLEIESLKMQDVSNHDELQDKVERAKAILSSAHLLTQNELEMHLSTLRMGNSLNLCDIDDEKIRHAEKLCLFNKKETISQSEMKDLANEVRNLFKGGKNV